MSNRGDIQNTTAKKCSRLLYDNVLTKFRGCLVMDDANYVKADPQLIKFLVKNIMSRTNVHVQMFLTSTNTSN